MSLFDSVFGGSAANAAYTSFFDQGQAYNGYNAQQNSVGYNQQSMANAYSAQQARAYTPPKWVVNGVPYYSITEFADAVFGDTPARTMFLLKYEDKGTMK